MPFLKPSDVPGRKRQNARAARRRVGPPPGYNTGSPAPSGTLPKGPTKGGGPLLKNTPGASTGPGKRTPGGKPVATAPGPATAPPRQQPVSAPRPSNVLGGTAGSGTSYLPGTQVNRGMPEAAVTGGGDRIGKRFTVGFTSDGRIVHLYGNDVPADQRRQVFKRARA
jgi:hypothetical protein